jgi:predicted phosphodiesterase
MRYLILSDMHGNKQALDAVLSDAATLGYDASLVLGDLVGYGADPAAIIDTTLALEPLAMIRGNHDKVCAGLEPATLFNDIARRSIEWTAGILSSEHLRLLADLPMGPALVVEGLEICHGTSFDEDYYVFDPDDARRAIDSAQGRLCLFGHTHVPAIYATSDPPKSALTDLADDEVALPAEGPVLLNAGSVGQPRDGDPRAAYGILDLERSVIRMRRVVYDIATAQSRIRAAGLPPALAARLERGQ